MQVLSDAVLDHHGRVSGSVAGPGCGLQEADDQPAVERRAARQFGIGGQLGPDGGWLGIRSAGGETLHRGQYLTVIRPGQIARENKAKQPCLASRI